MQYRCTDIGRCSNEFNIVLNTTFQHYKDYLNTLKKLDRTFFADRYITPNVTNTVLFIIITI